MKRERETWRETEREGQTQRQRIKKDGIGSEVERYLSKKTGCKAGWCVSPL